MRRFLHQVPDWYFHVLSQGTVIRQPQHPETRWVLKRRVCTPMQSRIDDHLLTDPRQRGPARNLVDIALRAGAHACHHSRTIRTYDDRITQPRILSPLYPYIAVVQRRCMHPDDSLPRSGPQIVYVPPFERPVLIRYHQGFHRLIFKLLATGHDFLLFLIKSDPFSSPISRICHDDGDSMIITRFYRRIWLLTAANAFHPVAHMRRC